MSIENMELTLKDLKWLVLVFYFNNIFRARKRLVHNLVEFPWITDTGNKDIESASKN
jgi:hypothetical protein